MGEEGPRSGPATPQEPTAAPGAATPAPAAGAAPPAGGAGGAARPSLWSPELELGVPLVDGQHRKLVDHLQALQEAIDVGRPRHEVAQCLAFLQQYTEEHFHTEERFLEQHRYPGLDQHRQLHAAFRANVDKAVRAVEERLSADQSVLLVKSMVVRWYVDHIKGADRQYSTILKNRGPL